MGIFIGLGTKFLPSEKQEYLPLWDETKGLQDEISTEKKQK